MPTPHHILIVDDEKGIRGLLRRFLVEEGFAVTEAGDAAAARAALDAGPVDLILLDLMLPGEDGLSLARQIRQRPAPVADVPIIMLTGKGDLIDRVVGLETGADDYIAKPFHLREVLARIRTVFRRTTPHPAAAAADPLAASDGEVLVFAGWRLDLLRRDLRRADGTPEPLTTAEFELLRAFAQHPNRVLSRDQLLDLVKGPGWAAFDRAIDTQVVRLRRRIEVDPAQPDLIKTVRGAGYIFAATVSRG
jgi:two-component system OmpR family response regulator